MSRTNIEIDDDLIATVMKQNALRTKREAVDFALRRVARPTLSREEMLALRGSMKLEGYEQLMAGDEERFRELQEAMKGVDPSRLDELVAELQAAKNRRSAG